MSQQRKTYIRAWRVQTDHSMTRLGRHALLAASKRSVSWPCRKSLLNHLNWKCESPSPYVSVTTDREWAFCEASRRKGQGETGVVVYEIRVSRHLLDAHKKKTGKRITYGKVENLLFRAGVSVPDYADYRCTYQEYLFLHEIPRIFIVNTSVI